MACSTTCAAEVSARLAVVHSSMMVVNMNKEAQLVACIATGRASSTLLRQAFSGSLFCSQY